MPSSVESSPTRRHDGSTTSAARAAAAAAGSAGPAVHSRQHYVTQIPLIFDSLTFDSRQEKWIKDIERKMEVEKKRKQREWERDVQRMRDEFLLLHPADRQWGSDELIVDPLVIRRRGSTDILDVRRMKTIYSGSASPHDWSPSHNARRYRLRFDLASFDLDSVRVAVGAERIVVRASRLLDSGERRDYLRKIQKPGDVDATKIKSSLTSDGVLTVGASLHSPIHSHHHSPASRCHSPSLSPARAMPPPPDLKPGVPLFRDEVGGQRRLHLSVDVGAMFKPNDVTIQVIKENRLVIRARHEERTAELVSKSKYCKEFDLGERIEGQSIRSGFSLDGRLFVTALVKGHGHIVGQTSSVDEQDDVAVDGELVLLADARGARLTPCNILDLASFPPSITTSASCTASTHA